MIARLPRWVAQQNATINTKLVAAFLLVSLLLLSAAAVGLRALTEMHQRAEQMVQLQRKIAAYRQLSHDTIAQLYGVAFALLKPEERRLDATLRQLKQFGYDLDRLQFLAQDELAVMGRVRADFEEFIKQVTRSVELIRDGKAEEGRELQLSVATPLADRLERLTNELVNKAEADLVGGIEIANQAYARSRNTVIACGIISMLLALGLGYAMSWSLITPIKRMEARMREIAAGDFAARIDVANRDELGTLAAGVNRMSEELGMLYAQVEAAREHAERSNLDKSRFLAAAAHDLRQPMHGLNLWLGNLRVALERGDARAAQRAMQTIETSCRSLSTSFNAILDLSKLEVGGVKPMITAVDLSKLLEQLHAEFEPLAQQKGLRFRLHRSKHGPLMVASDAVLLGRMLRNLVTNAIKYTARGGVVIGEIARGERIEIAVYDSGSGISDEQRAHLFSEFSHAARPDDAQGGMGLGLAIVQRSADVLAGHTLDFYSREGRGSRFSIRLPRGKQAAQTLAALGSSPRAARIPGSYVVVVEDEPSVLEGLVELLRNWGCLVEAGASGQELLRAVRENERVPDLLIADLRLANGETGIQASKLLNDCLAVQVPVLVLTGDLNTPVASDASRAPVKVMHKPIVASALREVLEDVLPVRQFV